MQAKFMARPEDLSYVIRLEAYDRILKAFTANRIRFAERRVTVFPLPSTGAGAIPGFAAAAGESSTLY